MSSNFHTAHSSKIKGAGLVIGTYYADTWTAGEKNVNNYQKSYDKATKFAGVNWVDDTKNLEGDPVFVLSGGRDEIVPPIKQEGTKDYYTLMKSNVLLHTIA